MLIIVSKVLSIQTHPKLNILNKSNFYIALNLKLEGL